MSNTNSLNQSKPFLKYIGYMQAICIILVVAGHSLHMYPDGHHGASTLAYRLIYSFHMPAFLFISGFLFDYSSSKHIGKIGGVIRLIKVKAERLLIPFFVLTAITFVPRALLSGIADDNIPLTWSAFMRAFFFDDSLVLVYFWFIQSLFLLSCIMSIFYYLVADHGLILKNVTLVSLAVFFIGVCFFCPDLCSISLLSIGKILELGVFFVLGCLCGAYRDKLEILISHDIAVATFAALWIASFNLFDGYMQCLLCGSFGILMTISFSYFLQKHKIIVVDHLVGANYMIFLLSWYVNVVTQQALSHVICMPWYCYSILSLGFGLYLPWLLYRYICMHQQYRCVRFLTFVLGQRV